MLDLDKQQYDTHTRKKERAGKRPKSKKLYLFLLSLVLLAIVGSGTATAYQHYTAEYHNDLAIANSGVKNIQTAVSLLQGLSKNPLNYTNITQAQHEFTASYAAFTQLDTDLQSLPAVGASIPIYGNRLSAALHLTPLAIEISQAGITACHVLSLIVTRFHQPLSTGQGMTQADLTTISANMHQLTAILNQATIQVNALQPSDLQLDPRIGKAVAAFHKYLPSLQLSLHDVNQLLPVLPSLLGIGTPTHYFIEILDSTELRPGGGFVGNYGIATVSGARLTTAHITDTYLLDDAFTASHRIAFPPAYSWFGLVHSWSLRDSNLDADFPTAAKYAEQNYKIEGGNTSLQGVVAITPFLIQKALAITGPIAVPEYHEIVTTQNLIDRIHYYQLGPGRQGQDTPSPDGNSSVRKRFTALLAEHFFARIHQLPSSALPQLFQLLVGSLHAKDLQLYFDSPAAENLLTLLQLDSSIQAPTHDGLFVVDANISPNKASQFISYTLNDVVTIDEQGNVIHHTTISYDWKMNGQVYGSGLYRDYLRVYVPSNSSLEFQQGWQARGTGQAFGQEVWAGFFTLTYGKTRTISFTWQVPGVAKKDTTGWHYQYLIQRQAGSHWNINVRMILPSCTTQISTSGGLTAQSKQVATFNQPLTKDTNLSVDYRC